MFTQDTKSISIPKALKLVGIITGIWAALGVVILQTLIGLKELSIKAIPKILTGLSFLTVIVYFIFAALVILYEQGAVGRNTPIVWEWLAIFLSVVWVFAQSILLGKTDSNV